MTAPDPRCTAASLTRLQRRVLDSLQPELGRGPSSVAADLGIPIGIARETLQFLRSEGLCVLSGLFDADSGLLVGRGYWIGTWGLKVRAAVALSP